MDTTSIIMIIAGGLLILANGMMLILNIMKRKNSGEITMNAEDYLTLILQQLDQVARDALEITKIDKNNYSTEKEYQLALLEIAKDRLFECGEEYGLSTNILSLIDSMKLDQYLLDSVIMATKKQELIEGEPVEAATPEEEDISEAIANIYDE